MPDKEKVVQLPDGRVVSFPASMSDADINAALEKETQPSAASRFFGGLITEPAQALASLVKKNVDLREERNVGRTIGNVLLGPAGGAAGGIAQDMLTGLGQAHLESFKKLEKPAGELLTSPSLGAASELLGRSLATILPGVGPAAGAAADRISSGDIAGGLGETTNLLATALAPAVSKTRAVRSVTKAVEVLPERLMKILQPSKATRATLVKEIPAALDEVFQTGIKVESLKDLDFAIAMQRKNIAKEMDSVLARNQQAISGKELAQAMRDSVDQFAEVTDANAVKQVRKVAKDIEKSYPQLGLDDAESFRRRLNKELGFFFRKSQAMKAEAILDPQVKARLALRDALEQTIEAKLGADALKPLRKRYSSLRSLEDAVDSKILSELVKEDPSLLNLDSIDTITAGSAVAAATTGQGGLALGLAKTVLARRIIFLLEKISKTPDVRIKAAFAKTRTLPRASAASQAARTLSPVLLAQDEQEQ